MRLDQPPNKALNRTLIAIFVIGVVMLGTVLYYAFRLWNSFEVPKSQVMNDAGCDLTQVAKLDDLSEKTAAQSGAQAVVMCLVGAEKTKHPKCEDVARAYGTIAPQGTRRFIVVVGILGDDRTPPFCKGVYDAAGTFVSEMPR